MILRKLLSSLAVIGVAAVAHAQTTEMNVNGLKVIFKPSEKQTVSAVMFFKGGTANYAKDQQGIESLAMSATTECGTKKYNKDAFKDIADQYSINLGGTSGYDFGYISMNCVKPYFNEGWDLFSSAITEPVFEEKELGLLKQKIEANLKQEEGDPDSKLSQMSMASTFKGTRYAIQPSGTPESITKFTSADVKKHYNALLTKERMVLVVVGNIEVAELKQKVEKAFSGLSAAPSGLPLMPVPQDLIVAENSFNKENRALATNYIMGMMGAPRCSDQQFNAYRLAVDILSDKLFEEVRTKRNLSYAPSAFVRSGLQPYAAIYVTTIKPKEAVNVMVDEIKRLRNNGFTAVELRDAKSQFATSYFMKNESNAAIAMALGAAEIRGSWRNEEIFLDRINAVQLPEMQAAFTAFANGIRWNYLGDEKQIDLDAFQKSTR